MFLQSVYGSSLTLQPSNIGIDQFGGLSSTEQLCVLSVEGADFPQHSEDESLPKGQGSSHSLMSYFDNTVTTATGHALQHSQPA